MGFFTSLYDDAKSQFRYGNMTNQIILVNLMVFLALLLVQLGFAVFGPSGNAMLHTYVLRWLAIPYDPQKLLFSPWTLVSYNFIHLGIMHLLWNMLFLFWFGRIVQDLLGARRILPIYIYGGIAGGLLSFALMFLVPDLNKVVQESLAAGGNLKLLGASAGVTAIVIAAAAMSPDYTIMLFMWPVKIKYIAVFRLVSDLFAVAYMADNAGGNIAHLGGAAFGYLFIVQLKNGSDLSIGFNKIFDRLVVFFNGVTERGATMTAKRGGRDRFGSATSNPSKSSSNPNPRSRPSRSSSNSGKQTDAKISKQGRVDEILDKIARSGYDSLSKEEKEFLFKVSKED